MLARWRLKHCLYYDRTDKSLFVYGKNFIIFYFNCTRAKELVWWIEVVFRYGRQTIVKSKQTLSPRSFERRTEVHPAISFLIQVYYKIIWFKENMNKNWYFVFYNYLLFFRYGRGTIVKSKRTLSPRSFERQTKVYLAISF
jgi:hypothetical protein